MNLLLDTHTIVWAMNSSPSLSRAAHRAIHTYRNQVFVSAVCFWEASTKFRLGRFPEAALLLNDPKHILDKMGFEALNIGVEHARLAGSLPGNHRDPFDRMLAAQATLDRLTLVSSDSRLW